MKRLVSKYLIAFLVLAGVFLVCIFAGSVGFPFGGSGESASFNSNFSQILFDLRFPRVMCAALVGAGLSICGVVMQGLLKNPLADGSTLGVSSGASIGAVLAIIFGGSLLSLTGVFQDIFLVVFSILGAVLSFALILFLAKKLDRLLSTNTIILVGIVFAMFASSIITLLIALFPENTRSVMFWTMGSFVGVNYGHCALLGVAFCVCFVLLLLQRKELNIMALGEASASHLGVNVRRSKMVILVSVSVLTGVCVSVAGTIGFVGLIVPHICRRIVGASHGRLMVFSSFFGASFLMLADLFSRIVIAPKELPIGVITSLIGAVVFVVIFYKQRRV